jgi:hypothetical protein
MMYQFSSLVFLCEMRFSSRRFWDSSMPSHSRGGRTSHMRERMCVSRSVSESKLREQEGQWGGMRWRRARCCLGGGGLVMVSYVEVLRNGWRCQY